MKGSRDQTFKFKILAAFLAVAPKGDRIQDCMISENKIATTIGTSHRKVARALPQLVKDGMVKRAEQKGKQGSNPHSLTLKGLYYLLYYGNLSDRKLATIYAKALVDIDDRQLRSVLRKLTAVIFGNEQARLAALITEMVTETKHMINFADFREEYAVRVLSDSLVKSFVLIATEGKEITGIRRDLSRLLNSETGQAIREALLRTCNLEAEEFKKHEAQHKIMCRLKENLLSLQHAQSTVYN